MPRAGQTRARARADDRREPERPLPTGTEPPFAAHVVTSRRWYSHHGIYVGNGRVVHYRGLSRGLRAGPVEEISVAEFASGRPVRIRPHAGARFDRHTIVARARSRLGEDAYRILSNNCEHFCEWCIESRSHSRQVERFITLPRRALLAALRVLVPADRGSAAAVLAD